MTMAKAKKKDSKEYTIIQKRSGRYSVKDKNGKYINADAKVEILLKEKKIKLSAAKKKDSKEE
jgi:hypothetical protein